MTDPSPIEIMLRLEQLTSRLADLAAQLAQDRADATRTFVRLDLYGEQTKTQDRRITDMETEAKEKQRVDAGFRRQILLAAFVVAVPAIFGLLLAINNFLAANGATP